MVEAQGIGLAANRSASCGASSSSSPEDGEIVASSTRRSSPASEETEVADEGCLSIQGVLVPVERALEVTLAGRDEHGEEVSYELTDIHARAAQHESDHLDGVLMLDRTTPEARREALGDAPPAHRPPEHGEDRGRRECALRRRRAGAARCGARGRARPDEAGQAAWPWSLGRADCREAGGRAARDSRFAAPAARRDDRAAGRDRRRRGVRAADSGVAALARAVAERAPLAAAALARRSARRARAHGGRRAHRRDDPSHDGGRSTPARSRGRRHSTSRPRTTRRSCTRAAPSSLQRCSTRRSRIPCSTRSRDEGVTYAEKITAADRRSIWPVPRRRSSITYERCRLTSARAPHRRTAADRLARARLRSRLPRAARGATGGKAAHDVRRVPPRTALIMSSSRLAGAPSSVRGAAARLRAGCVRRSRLPHRSEGLDERERAFAQRLAYGTVQRVRTLDHAIESLGKRPVRKLDPPVRAALRLGAYQLGYLDRAPHAAANESVELVRRARLERAVPFTNAVMRRLAAGIRGAARRRCRRARSRSRIPTGSTRRLVRDLGRTTRLR